MSNREVMQRSDGMPTSKTERDLRRMLCIARHGGSAYMDDGEASFCGDKYYRSIDYMRESIESIIQAWYDAGFKRLSGAQPEQQAEPVAYFDFQEQKFSWAKHMKIGPVPVSIKVEPMKLYLEAPQRQWVGLTDEEILRADPRFGKSESDVNPYQILGSARDLEAKLKERNT